MHLSGQKPDFTPLLKAKCSPFHQLIWEIFLSTPHDKTITYSEISHTIARKNVLERMSAQAVGNAVGHNPIALIIPCHRVLGADGSLTGYAAGTNKKDALLQLE
ncbi:MAG: MGMT family protein [Bacteroidales bacterium]|nr:MGMT family protein [Bacteroidales bacterium]